MKFNKGLIKTQRHSLDQKLIAFHQAREVSLPKSGWIKAIRESLGMTSRQLAERMGIQQSGVILLERREVDKKVSLELLERAAKALHCKLVYALVPEVSLEKNLEEQSILAAKEILQGTLHTMDLEQQSVSSSSGQFQLEELSQELRTKLDSRLWNKK